MSYFYGMPVTSMGHHYDDKISNSMKKSSRNDSSANGSKLVAHRSSRHRRKHSSSRRRCVPKIEDACNIVENDESQSISTNTKHKRYKEKHENVGDDEKLRSNVTLTPESGFMEENSERETLFIKQKNKYIKLQKDYEELHVNYAKLQAELEKKDSENRDLHANHDGLLKHIQLVEQEKKNVFIEHKKISTENAQLNEDVMLLKILIYQLNVELERYQNKLRTSNQKHDDSIIENLSDGVDSTAEKRKIFQSWGRVNFHALGPLLEAFQENIREKEHLIKQYRQECDDFGAKCKEIVSENEELRKDVDDLRSKVDILTSEMKVLVDDAAIVKDENNILIKQASLQKQKLHEIHAIYEKKVNSMSEDNNRLHQSYASCRTELSNLQGKYEILSDGYEKLKKNSEKTMPISVHSDAIEECKRLFEELKIQYETEKKKLVSQLKKFEESNPENDKIIATLTAERDHLKQLSRNLEKNSKRIQHKMELIQNAVCSIQLSRDSYKRQLAKTTAYCERLITEHEKLLAEKEDLVMVLHKREKENESIKYLGTTIAQRMNTLKSQLKGVQKGAQQQLETVEKHIKMQKVGVGQLKSDYHHELERLKQLIKQKEDVIGKLQREKCATQENLDRVWQAATSDDIVVKDALKHANVQNIRIDCPDGPII